MKQNREKKNAKNYERSATVDQEGNMIVAVFVWPAVIHFGGPVMCRVRSVRTRVNSVFFFASFIFGCCCCCFLHDMAGVECVCSGSFRQDKLFLA